MATDSRRCTSVTPHASCRLRVAASGPLSRVPENTLKYAVGVILTTFGMFWGAEGAGAQWPGGDAAIPVLLVFTFAVSLALTESLRRDRVAA